MTYNTLLLILGVIMDGKTRTTDVNTLRNIIDATSAAIHILGPDGLIIDCNSATFSMFRVKNDDEIIGRPPSVISSTKQSNSADSVAASEEYIKRAFSGETVSFEWEHQRLDGTVFPCTVTLELIEYEGTTCLMSTVVDTSDIIALRKKTAMMIENAPIPMIDLKPDLSIIQANHAFSDLISKSHADLLGMKLTDFDVKNRAGESLTEGIEEKRQVKGEMDALVPGGIRHLQYHYSPFFDDAGNLLSIFAYYINKTDEINAVRDIVKLTGQCQAGILDSRLDSTHYSGELKQLIEGINGTLDSIIGPLNVAAEYMDRIAKGDIPPRLTEEYHGDFNEIKNNLNNCIDSLNQLMDDTSVMNQEQKAGNIEALIDTSRYLGFYKDITHGLNEAISLHVSGVLKILDLLSSYAEGDFNPVLEQMPGKQALANEKLDQLRDNILALVEDCNLLTRAAVEGRLDTRAETGNHKGDYLRIVEGLNNTLDAVVRPIRDAERILGRFVVNDHSPSMDEDKYHGEFKVLAENLNQVKNRLLAATSLAMDVATGNTEKLDTLKKTGRRSEQDELMPAFITCMENVQRLIKDIGLLSSAANEGNLDVRVDPSNHEGEYRRIVEEMNITFELMADRVAWFESILDAMQFPVSVTDLDARWTFVNKAVEKMLKVSRKDIIGRPCKEWGTAICGTENCGIKKLQNGFNTTNYEQNDGYFKVDTAYVKNAKGEDVGHVEVVSDVTAMKKVENYLDLSVENISFCLNKFAKGETDFDVNVPDSDEYTNEVGKKIVSLADNIHQARDSVKDLVLQANNLAKDAIRGNLKSRADTTRVAGDFAEVLDGINNTLESVVTPVQEAIKVADEYALANFTARFDPALQVEGDWTGFKISLDNIGIQICEAIRLINVKILELTSNTEEATTSVQEISSGAQQIAQNMGSVNANAEQGDIGIVQILKAMEDFTITVGEVSQRAEMVSGSATEANLFSKEGIELARKSEAAMKGIIGSTSEVNGIVQDINLQMGEIGKIVRLITDISNQTNLLALNAAIEAARAGDAGRGFAVVAAEVKSLAQDSRVSAENIADMISNLQVKTEKATDAIVHAGTAVEDGNQALGETIGAFSKIVESIEDITKNAVDMASSSEEQAAAVEEITASVNEVSILVQGTSKEAGIAATATEEASVSIEQIGVVVANVSGIADSISKEMAKFKI